MYNYLGLSKEVSVISLPQILTDLENCHVAFLYIFFSNTWPNDPLEESTVGPRTERPQAERVSQLNDFELGPSWFELNEF